MLSKAFLRYPNITSHVLTEGGIHTFHCPSKAEFSGTPDYTVITRWFRQDLAIRNDTYHTTFFDGRLEVQTLPEEGEYICLGYLPLPGYPQVLLMRANLSVVSPTSDTPTVPTTLPVWAIAVIPIGNLLVRVFRNTQSLSGVYSEFRRLCMRAYAC